MGEQLRRQARVAVVVLVVLFIASSAGCAWGLSGVKVNDRGETEGTTPGGGTTPAEGAASGIETEARPPVLLPFRMTVMPEDPGVGELVTVTVEAGWWGPFFSVMGVFGNSVDDRVVKFYLVGDRWVALVPVSSWWPAGTYQLELTMRRQTGDLHYSRAVTVVDREYPEQRITMAASTAATKTDDRLAADWARTSAARESSHPAPLWHERFIMPLEGPITSEFGLTRYVNGVASGRHTGLDIAGPTGAPVKATNTGVVVFADELYVSGNTVILDHGANLFSSYSHLSEIRVELRATVERGQSIGLVGSTGYSTGPHLHWTTTVGTTGVSPWLLVKRDAEVAAEILGLVRDENSLPARR